MALEEVAGGLSPVGWSPDGKSILLAQARQAGQQLYVCELKDHDLKRLNHPDGTYQVLRFDQEGEILALWQDVLQPPQVVALDAETGAKTRTVLSAGEAPPSRGWQCVSFPSSEGRMVQGWLAVPDGEGPFPTVLYVYHGPGGATFHPEGQAWLDHGFACASIHNMIAADIGLRALEDVVTFRDWLVKNRMTNPDQIILTGWSYGGYLALLALGKYPDLWAGGMAGTAIADWSTLYEDTSPAGRSRVLSLFGGTPQEEPGQYADRSPISWAERVQAPVLAIQGKNDTAATPRQMQLYEAKMKSLGKHIEVVWFEGGHGAMCRTEHTERMLRFACQVLG